MHSLGINSIQKLHCTVVTVNGSSQFEGQVIFSKDGLYK